MKNAANILSEYAKTAKKLEALKAKEKAIKEEIIKIMDRYGKDSIVRGEYEATRLIVESERVDTAAVKEILGEETPTVTVKATRFKVVEVVDHLAGVA